MTTTTFPRSRGWSLAVAACALLGSIPAVGQETTTLASALMGAPPSTQASPKQAPKTQPPKRAADHLPAFPRHPQLYHRGAGDFFLDCPEPLTEKQTAALKAIRAKSQRETAEADEKIAKADRELWKLTGAASPDLAAISAAIAEIERTRAQQRMTFIRRVGEADAVLNDKQRSATVRGWAEVQEQEPASPEAHAAAAPPPRSKKRPPKGKSSPPPEAQPADDDASD